MYLNILSRSIPHHISIRNNFLKTMPPSDNSILGLVYWNLQYIAIHPMMPETSVATFSPQYHQSIQLQKAQSTHCRAELLGIHGPDMLVHGCLDVLPAHGSDGIQGINWRLRTTDRRSGCLAVEFGRHKCSAPSAFSNPASARVYIASASASLPWRE
jgi:hypothetical protein